MQQITFAIIKPDILLGHAFKMRRFMQVIHENQFVILRDDIRNLSMDDAVKFYQEHKGRFYYERLIRFMTRWVWFTFSYSPCSPIKTTKKKKKNKQILACSGPIRTLVLSRENAVSHLRQLIGPTHHRKYNSPSISFFFFRFMNKNPTKQKNHLSSYRLQPGTLRFLFGCTDTKNSIHGSGTASSHSLCAETQILVFADSPETALKEIRFFYHDFKFGPPFPLLTLTLHSLTILLLFPFLQTLSQLQFLFCFVLFCLSVVFFFFFCEIALLLQFQLFVCFTRLVELVDH
jgi:nucleoside-diphosphate kinase